MYFASSVPHAEKFQHVPEICEFGGEFQLDPLTLCQVKLSAKAICDDRQMPNAKTATTEEARQKNDLQPRISETPFRQKQVTTKDPTIIQRNHHVTLESKNTSQ